MLDRLRRLFGSAQKPTPVDTEAEQAFARAIGLIQARQPLDALDALDALARKSPSAAGVHFNRGGVLTDLGRHAEAVAALEKAASLMPDSAAVHVSLGSALAKIGRQPQALASLERAVRLDPGSVDAREALADLFREQGRFEEAVASYEWVLAAAPRNVHALNSLGIVLQNLKRFADALPLYETAMKIDPRGKEILVNRGATLAGLGRHKEALASYERALRVDPLLGTAHANKGNALRELGRHREAIESYERAKALGADLERFFLNEAVSRLVLGDFSAGWPQYEWRWFSQNPHAPQERFAQPLWTGETALTGKTILLWAEQGFGDTIQFSRFARNVQAMGARVLLEVQPALVQLVQGIEGVTQVIARGEKLPAFDLHCPLLSLPLALGIRLSTIPDAGGYLKLSSSRFSERAEAWSERLAPRTGLLVGLAWSGNPKHDNDHNRSVGLSSLAVLEIPGVRYVVLQKEVRDDDLEELRRRTDIVDLRAELDDFVDTAALISRLDLVLSVDTSVAHLSGAMGRPTWILVPKNPDWRWLLNRSDSPWYETVKLFRQDVAGDWTATLGAVGKELRLRAA